MIAPLLLMGLLSWPGTVDGRLVHQSVRHVGGWTLVMTTDRFTGGAVCRLSRRHMEYERHTVAFSLSRRLNTAMAVYRVDDGAPVAARTDDMVLAGLGFALQDDDLVNPSGGRVRIPLRRLNGAHWVAIETELGRPAARFHIDGLGEALVIAHEAGCEREAAGTGAPGT